MIIIGWQELVHDVIMVPFKIKMFPQVVNVNTVGHASQATTLYACFIQSLEPSSCLYINNHMHCTLIHHPDCHHHHRYYHHLHHQLHLVGHSHHLQHPVQLVLHLPHYVRCEGGCRGYFRDPWFALNFLREMWLLLFYPRELWFVYYRDPWFHKYFPRYLWKRPHFLRENDENVKKFFGIIKRSSTKYRKWQNRYAPNEYFRYKCWCTLHTEDTLLMGSGGLPLVTHNVESGTTDKYGCTPHTEDTWDSRTIV